MSRLKPPQLFKRASLSDQLLYSRYIPGDATKVSDQAEKPREEPIQAIAPATSPEHSGRPLKRKKSGTVNSKEAIVSTPIKTELETSTVPQASSTNGIHAAPSRRTPAPPVAGTGAEPQQDRSILRAEPPQAGPASDAGPQPLPDAATDQPKRKERKKPRWRDRMPATATADASSAPAAAPAVKAASPIPAATAGEAAAALVAPGEVSGNLAQAQLIRQVLGYAAAAPPPQDADRVTSGAAAGTSAAAAELKPSAGIVRQGRPGSAASKAFSFGFSIAAQKAEDESAAKVARLMAMDVAKDGFVPRKVWVCGIPHEWSEDDIKEFWAYCGAVEALECLSFRDSGRFNGVCFVTFKTQAGYEAALQCAGEEVEGRPLRVEKCKAATDVRRRDREGAFKPLARGSSPAPGDAAGADTAHPLQGVRVHEGPSSPAPAPARVEGYDVAYVGNIAFEVTAEEVSALFTEAGAPPTQVRLHVDKDTGKHKGFAHVHFAGTAALDIALSCQGMRLGARELRVTYAQPPKAQPTNRRRPVGPPAAEPTSGSATVAVKCEAVPLASPAAEGAAGTHGSVPRGRGLSPPASDKALAVANGVAAGSAATNSSAPAVDGAAAEGVVEEKAEVVVEEKAMKKKKKRKQRHGGEE